jgi:hypothetical protein
MPVESGNNVRVEAVESDDIWYGQPCGGSRSPRFNRLANVRGDRKFAPLPSGYRVWRATKTVGESRLRQRKPDAMAFEIECCFHYTQCIAHSGYLVKYTNNPRLLRMFEQLMTAEAAQPALPLSDSRRGTESKRLEVGACRTGWSGVMSAH